MFRYNPIGISHRVFQPVRRKVVNKPPIIFMHNLMESKDKWKEVAARVARLTRRRVYTYDARNHGESEHTMDSGLHNNMYDLLHFMDGLEIDRAVLVGHGMGGMTAIEAALVMPSRVEIPFIVNMTVDRLLPKTVNKLLSCMLIRASEICSIHTDRRNMAITRFPPPPDKLEKAEELYNSVNLFRYMALSHALLFYDESSWELFGQFNGPIYFYFCPETGIGEEVRFTDETYLYFPKADVIESADFSNDTFQSDHLIKAICSAISR